MSLYHADFGNITPAEALELASIPWGDPDEVGVAIAATKSMQPSGGGRPMSMDDWFRVAEETGLSGGASPADTVLRVGTVFACVRVIAEDTAKLPRHLYAWQRRADGRTTTAKAVEHPLYRVLTDAPNDWMTGQELIEYMVGQAALRGAAYAQLVREPGWGGRPGRVTEILPLLPGTCRREQDDRWGISYVISGYDAGEQRLQPHDVWALNGPMLHPVTGADVRSLAGAAVALAQTLETSQLKFHRTDARPSGILTTASNITPDQRNNIKSAWQSAYGPNGSGGTAILDQGFDFKPMTISAADSQTIESRSFQIEEICRFFRVHPWAIMRQTSSQAYASIEQTALAHIQHTIQTWVTRVEQSVQRDIIGRDEDVFLKVNINALARSTLTDRVNAYKSAVTVYMTPNEIRDLEDMDPLADPAMDRVQLLANNTGLAPSATTKPDAGKPGAADPPKPQLAIVPTGA